ncbi:MAG: carboxypeptidase-like regulatory domain-containing protein, partial [Tannerellaceae bacterium]
MKLVNQRPKNKVIATSLLAVLFNLPSMADITHRQTIPTDINQKASNTIKVNGTVLDELNTSLPGVNVVVKGTTIGTTTDLDGNYFIEVPSKNAVLVFSYIGYEPQEVKVGNQINISLKMKEVSTGLNEVVVVGYGSQKRASVIGSITTIAPEKLQQSPSRALSNNLAGQLSGVIAVQRSGEPGKDGSSFWIRGISSFQSAGRSPLVLVDGIERTLDDMDPAEIESFSVLKD